MRNTHPSQGCHRAPGIVLMQGPRGALFLLGEVPLYYSRALSCVIKSSVSPVSDPPLYRRIRCGANLAHIRQSRPDFEIGLSDFMCESL